MGSQEDFQTAATNRALRSIKCELAFLTDSQVITPQQLSSILEALPSETELYAPIPLQSSAGAPTAGLKNLGAQARGMFKAQDEKSQSAFSPPPVQSPPAYQQSPAQTPGVLTYATALYPYTATDAGDLALAPNEKIAVTEYMNAEWWKGRSERTGREGIFPRNYVRVEEKPQARSTPSSYGNMPLAVAQDRGASSSNSEQQQPSRARGNAEKMGKKVGNAALFGAGATIGSKVVNSVF